MWHDNETERDFLNFSGVSETVAEVISQASGRPISIGVSGSWGVGKSSMIKLIRTALGKKSEGGPTKFIFVEFNAWLYQGYDDARAALMDVIAEKLHAEAEARKTGLGKTRELLKRVRWLRLAKLTVGPALSLAMGIPPLGFLGTALDFGTKLMAGQASGEDITKASEAATSVAKEAGGLLNPKEEFSPPKEIQALRDCFEASLEELGITLVVLIDDLDRCLQQTTISTLEAIRLFLFLKNTAFVIAADDAMIKHAVRQHFGNVEEPLVISYFDKLIQVPIRVPPLGTQEVRAYLILLFVENSSLSPAEKELVRSKVCAQLAQTWRGARVDRAFMQTMGITYPADLIAKFDTADRLAPLMTTASQIAGNPRLIKRFLNALSIRMSISNAHGVGVDEAVLAKMMLFERSGDPAAYDALVKAINQNDEGKPSFLADWEGRANAGETLKLDPPWASPFVQEWLTLAPSLSGQDLRGALYVSREHTPLVTPEDRLSSTSAELLAAFLAHPDVAKSMKDKMATVPRPELEFILDRLLRKAAQEQEWGAPPILDACLTVVGSDSSLGKRLAGFLRERPFTQIKPSIVPKIASEPWSKEVFDAWKAGSVSGPVKKAITQSGQHGNI